MDNLKEKARNLLREFKGDNYLSGLGVFEQIGQMADLLGKNILVVADGIGSEWANPVLKDIEHLLNKEGVTMAGALVPGAKPNAPREDVIRIAGEIENRNPDAVISIGGGSTIDAVKAAIAFSLLGKKYPELDVYFGNAEISGMLSVEDKQMIPHLSVMMAASSAAHLTKYANITDMTTNQKLLIVDLSVVPQKALFDYSMTITQPQILTVDGALDGISHSLEVLMGIPENQLETTMQVCLTGIELIVSNLKTVVAEPENLIAREAIGLGTDLGGYAIMLGGTNGAHLNSFSMTDILSHGRACALMNPYYVVFFSPAIEDRIRKVCAIFSKAGYITDNTDKLSGRELGVSLAKGMFALSKEVGFPTTLSEVAGFSDEHIERCLQAAKNPKLDSKLKNMPVPLTASTIDTYMKPILLAAKTGNLDLIKNM